MSKTCFVIMAIGDQFYGEHKITSTELKEKYNSLIKEAIVKADPSIEVIRADEISAPGTISTDIMTRIMHSDIVIADITYPNPNVFYELGLRHACKAGTIIIKEKNSVQVPFDISHLRHIQYENTTAGLQTLSGELRKVFQLFSLQPNKPDNHFLELASLTGYEYPNYSKSKPKIQKDGMVQAMSIIAKHPKLLDMMLQDQPEEQREMMKFVVQQPDLIRLFSELSEQE